MLSHPHSGPRRKEDLHVLRLLVLVINVRYITATVAETLSGNFQILYEDKTERCQMNSQEGLIFGTPPNTGPTVKAARGL